MKGSSPGTYAVAERLIAFAREKAKHSYASQVSAPFGIALQLLGVPLIPLTGEAGFRSLLSRSLALAILEVKWLRAVHVKSDGSLEFPDLSQIDAKEIARGETVLMARLLGLLETFVGKPLTLRLVQDAFPTAPAAQLSW